MAYVSDHAVLRYLERVEGVDIEAIRRKLTVEGIDTAARIGCNLVKLGDGTRLRLVGDTAVTCLGKRKKKRHG